MDISLIVYADENQAVRSLEGDALARWLELEDERAWTAQFAATADDQWDRIVDQVRRDIAAGRTIPLHDVFPPPDDR